MTDRRMISAAIWEDEFVGSLTFFERLLWIGLITACADDQGRMMYNVNVIRSRVFMYDENLTGEKIEEAIQKFGEAGKLTRYSDGKGRSFIQLNNWWKYQSMQWPQPSRFPEPPGWIDRVRYHSSNRQIVSLNWDKVGGYDCAEQTTESQPEGLPTGSGSALPRALPTGLPSGLPRALPSGQGRGIEYEDDDEDVERDEEQQERGGGDLLPDQSVYPEWPAIPDAAVAERVFQKVTGMVTFPGRSRSSDIERICALYDKHREKTAEYLAPFWQAWLGRGYNKTNTGWIDWAISGQIPPKPNERQSTKAIDAEIGTNDPTIRSAYSYLKLNPKGPGREGALNRLRSKGYDYVDDRLIKLENAA